MGCEEIIDKLAGYQQIARNMKARNRQSRGSIPTNFLFKGPPGESITIATSADCDLIGKIQERERLPLLERWVKYSSTWAF